MNEDAISRAYKSWQRSIAYFNEATEKEDIDYAVFDMEAKRMKYLHLLKLKKQATEGAK